MEVWKDVPDYEGDYQASNLGRVKSLKYGKERILKQNINKYGYYYVSLCKNCIQKVICVHLVIAKTFLQYSSDLYVDHIAEGNKLDNRLENLRLVTNRENVSKHRLTVQKTSIFTGVSFHKHSKKWRATIMLDKKRTHIGFFNTQEDASIAYQNKLNTYGDRQH